MSDAPAATSAADPAAAATPAAVEGSSAAATATGTETTAATTTAAVETTATETAAAELTLAPIENGILDETGVANVLAMAKDLGLNQEQADKFLAAQDGALRSFQDGQIAAFEQRQAKWVEDAAKDTEIGGDKAEVVDRGIATALQRFDPDGAFKAELDATGYGKHPIVRKFISRIGAAMGEDKGTGSLQSTPAPASMKDADLFYGPK